MCKKMSSFTYAYQRDVEPISAFSSFKDIKEEDIFRGFELLTEYKYKLNSYPY